MFCLKLKKLTNLQRLSIIIPFSLVIASALLLIQVSFNNKEIQSLSQGCYDINGAPEFEFGVLNLDYKFECK